MTTLKNLVYPLISGLVFPFVFVFSVKLPAPWPIVSVSAVAGITLLGIIIELHRDLQNTNSVLKNFALGFGISLIRSLISTLIVFAIAMAASDLGGFVLMMYGLIIYAGVFVIGLVYSGVLSLTKNA